MSMVITQYKILQNMQTVSGGVISRTQKIRINCICDTAADLPAMNYVSVTEGTLDLAQGSTALIIDTSKRMMLNGSGVWTEILPAAQADTYSRQDIDDMYAALNGLISDNAGMISDLTDTLRPIVDSACGKNIFDTAAGTSTIGEVTFTNNNDGTWTTTQATDTAARRQKTLSFTVEPDAPSGQYIFTGCPAGGEAGGTIKYCMYLWDATLAQRVTAGNDTGDGLIFNWSPDSTHSYNVTIDVRSGQTVNGLIWKPMICLKSYYDISHDFVPYSPTLPALYRLVKSYHP